MKIKYDNMLNLIKNQKPAGVNCYTCKDCGAITKTVDVDGGTTPFMHICEICSRIALSSFYIDIAPTQEPTQEWYRPSLDELKGFKKEDAGTVEHILRGGLINRKII